MVYEYAIFPFAVAISPAVDEGLAITSLAASKLACNVARLACKPANAVSPAGIEVSSSGIFTVKAWTFSSSS